MMNAKGGNRMAASAFSLAKVHEDVQRLRALVPSCAPRSSSERIEELAALIRAADDLLAEYPPETPDDPLDLSSSRALIQMLRRTAFAYMQEVNRDQAWFWTEEWQAGEREADADIAAGNLTYFASDEEFDAHLRRLRPDLADV
jgi:hypothetical protein